MISFQGAHCPQDILLMGVRREPRASLRPNNSMPWLYNLLIDRDNFPHIASTPKLAQNQTYCLTPEARMRMLATFVDKRRTITIASM
jgi:hypothetical protein